MPPGPAQRREAILAAALKQFERYGFRRTAMEDVAREAGVSRPSLYQHFRNKEEIFRSLSQALHEASLAAAESALKADAPIDARARAALEAKVGRLLEIVHRSPHGAELLDENSRLCGDVVAASEERMRRMLARALRDAARDGEPGWALRPPPS